MQISQKTNSNLNEYAKLFISNCQKISYSQKKQSQI